MTIVLNLKQLQTAFFDQNLDLGRPGVQGILNQFLQGVGRPLNDLHTPMVRASHFIVGSVSRLPPLPQCD